MNHDLNEYLNNTANQGLQASASGNNPRKRKGSRTPSIDNTNYLGGVGAYDYNQDITNDDYLAPNFSYDSPYDVNEVRATNQSGLDKTVKGLGRIAAKIGVELAKMPGYIGGIPAAMAAEDGQGWEELTNNAWIKSLNNFGDTINDEVLPVYVKKAVKEGNLIDNITSVDFWATEGADGIGYIVSMMAPGAILKGLGVGNKIAKLPGLAGKIKPGSIDVISATMANTLMEASAEAGGAMENHQKELDLKLQKGLITLEEYDNSNEQKARLGRDIFYSNVAILLGPNAFQSTLLYGKMKPNSFKAFSNPTNDINPSALKALSKTAERSVNTIGDSKSLYNAATGLLELPTTSKLSNVGNILKKSVLGGLPEAWEELSQSTAENMFSEKARKGQLTSNMLNDFSLNELSQAYLDTMASTDGQKAMFLGFILGAPMAGWSANRDLKNKKKQDQNLVLQGNKAIQAFNQIHDYKSMYNEDGSLNYLKVLDKVEGLSYVEELQTLMQQAILRNDTIALKELQDLAARQLVYEFAMNEENGAASLNDYLESSGKISEIVEAEQNNNEKASFKETKDKILKIAESTRNNVEDFTAFSELFIDDALKNTATPEQILAFKLKKKGDYISTGLELESLTDKFKELENVKKRLLKNWSIAEISDSISEDVLKNDETNENDERLDKINRETSAIKEHIKSLQKELSDFWKPQTLKKSYKEFIDENEHLVKNLNDDIAEELDKQIQQSDLNKQEQIDAIKNSTYDELLTANKDKLYDLKDEEIAQVFSDELEKKQPSYDVDEMLPQEASYDDFFGDENDENDNNAENIETVENNETVENTLNDSVSEINTSTPSEINNTLINDNSNKGTGKVVLGDKALTPGIGSLEYKQYLANRKDKQGDIVTFRLNKNSLQNAKNENQFDYEKAFKLYDKAVSGELLNKDEVDFLIAKLPIEFVYINKSSSFSAFPENIPQMQLFRSNIINAISKGYSIESLSTKVIFQNQGDIVSERDVNNKPVKNSILELPYVKEDLQKDINKLTIYHVNNEGNISLISNGSDIASTSTKKTMLANKGEIFLAILNNKGGVLPLKLNTGKLNEAYAHTLSKIYSKILQDPEFRTKPLGSLDLNNNVSDIELSNMIQDVFKAEIELLGGDVDIIQTQALIDVLINEKSERISLIEKVTFEGINYITYDNVDYFLNSTESIDAFTQILNNRSRNIITTNVSDKAKDINIKNPKYVKYLVDNEILTTDANLEEPIRLKSSKAERGSELYLDNTIIVQNVKPVERKLESPSSLIIPSTVTDFKKESNKDTNLKQKTDGTWEGVYYSQNEKGDTQEIKIEAKTKSALKTKLTKLYKNTDILTETTETVSQELSNESMVNSMNTVNKSIEDYKEGKINIATHIENLKQTSNYIEVTPDEKHYINKITGVKYERVSNTFGVPSDLENITDDKKLLLKTATTLGSRMDDAMRDFFKGSVNNTEDLSKYNLTTNPQFLNTILEGFKNINKSFKERGETPITDNIILYSDNLGVAGATDIITYDKDGNFRIYDQKTMRGNQFESVNGRAPKYDTVFSGMSSRMKHQTQLSSYRILAENTFGLEAVELIVVPIAINYTQGVYQLEQVEFLNNVPIVPINTLIFKINNGKSNEVSKVGTYGTVAKSENKETTSEIIVENTQSVKELNNSKEFEEIYKSFYNKLLNQITSHRPQGSQIDEFFEAPLYIFNPNAGTFNASPIKAKYYFAEEHLVKFKLGAEEKTQTLGQFLGIMKNNIELFWKNQKNSVPLQNTPTINNTKEVPLTSTEKIAENIGKEVQTMTIDTNKTTADGLNVNELQSKITTLDSKIESGITNLIKFENKPEIHAKLTEALNKIKQERSNLKNELDKLIKC